MSFEMDVVSFLKTVPAVIGVAGFLTYFMRTRAPDSGDQLVTVVQSVRNTFLLLGCAALILLSGWLIFRPVPPDHDAALSGERCHMRGCPSSMRVTAKQTVPAPAIRGGAEPNGTPRSNEIRGTRVAASPIP